MEGRRPDEGNSEVNTQHALTVGMTFQSGKDFVAYVRESALRANMHVTLDKLRSYRASYVLYTRAVVLTPRSFRPKYRSCILKCGKQSPYGLPSKATCPRLPGQERADVLPAFLEQFVVLSTLAAQASVRATSTGTSSVELLHSVLPLSLKPECRKSWASTALIARTSCTTESIWFLLAETET
ncbi:hypothetical protein H257_00611 [Aphanomyces astaci]|uniref:Uncharacterized protein n=1 Tax=Aphanomyces astaci TaxID=112090 RepID=W4HB79_APHAT|nr:hypothetical protein H257_00611 [Aphanomyces astaci]ETV89270.1 hypothetical protein H257_00611 [Aphanomyces astaci]|eukprot:XP_009821670.1 hypothetical protein H257_00611 [Aphanomyces astaci]